MDILDLREAGEDGGDLMGFYAKGHHDCHAFAEAANKHNAAESWYDRRHVRADDCRHSWWRTVPMAGQAGCTMFVTAEPNSRGSYAVTVWDGLAKIESDTSKRVIREHHRGRCNGIAEGINWALKYVEAQHGFDAAEQMLTAFRAKRDQIEGQAI